MMIRRLAMLAVVLAATLAFADNAEVKPLSMEHLLLNGGFEEGFKHWVLRGTEGPVYTLVTGDEAFAGNQAARMTVTETSPENAKNAAYVARIDLPREPGYYRMDFAMKTALTRGAMGPYVVTTKADGKYLTLANHGKSGVPIAKGATPWRDYWFVYHLPPGAYKKVVVQCQMVNSRGTAWLDHVRLKKLSDQEGKKLMQTQFPQAPTLQEVGAKNLGAPCRIVNARIGKFFKHPETGRNLLVINSCTPGGGSGLLIDYLADEKRVVPFPQASGGWDVVELAPGKLLFESLGPLYLTPVDVASGTVIADRIKFVQRSTYAWHMVKGPDGKIYFGSYPTCHAYRYDPKTHEVEDLGKMGKKKNLYVRHVGVTGDGWLVCSVGTENNGTVAYNIATKKQRQLPDPAPSRVTTVGNDVYGSVFLGMDENHKPMRRMYRFNSKTIRFEDPGIPAPGGQHWTVMLPNSTPERLMMQASDSAYWVVENGGAPRKFWDLNLRGGELVGIDDQGNVVGYRGQDYFVARPMDKTLILKPLAVMPPPTAMHFLRSDPIGGVTGGPSFGQTLFRLDPARSLMDNSPQVVDGGGEVYDGRWIDGKFYFIAYGGGDLGVWDPAQPWDQWNNQNPKVVAKYNGPDHHSLIRPQGGMIVGPKGRLYSGFSAKYGSLKGGISEYDPQTDKARSWSSDLVATEVSIGTVAGDDRYLYAVTSNHFNGLRPAAKELIFFVFDPETGKVLYRETLKDMTQYAAVACIPATNHIWLTTPDGIKRFDPEKMSFVQTVAWPREANNNGAVSKFDTQGNRAWFAADTAIVELTDGPKPTVRTRFRAPKSFSGLAAGHDGMLYFTQELEVWAAPL